MARLNGTNEQSVVLDSVSEYLGQPFSQYGKELLVFVAT
jgi:hypothetical protein